jgi:hypothetical protein
MVLIKLLWNDGFADALENISYKEIAQAPPRTGKTEQNPFTRSPGAMLGSKVES